MLRPALMPLPLLLLVASCVFDPEDEIEIDFDTEEAAKPAPDAPAPAAGRVTFGRDGSERIFGVQIRDKAHRKPKVVYSVRLADVRADEQLLLRGEVTLSRCNRKDIAGLSGDAKQTPCDSAKLKADPYGYAPRFSAAFVLADSANDASGRRESPWFDRLCTEGQHHCALAVPQVRVDDLADAAEAYVNLVVTADARDANARSWDVMEVEQRKGALAVTRLGAGAGGVAIAEDTTKLRTDGAMGIDRPKEDGDPTQVHHELYQIKLTGLQGGDVIDADARFRAVLGNGFSCDPLITADILVTEQPGAKEPQRPHDERITIKNGANCADHSNDGCKYDESGAVRIKSGAPSTMYVTYQAVALRSCAAPGGGDTWRVRDGSMSVRVRR